MSIFHMKGSTFILQVPWKIFRNGITNFNTFGCEISKHLVCRRLQATVLSFHQNYQYFYVHKNSVTQSKRISNLRHCQFEALPNSLCKICHLAFNLPKAHSIWLRAERNI